MNKDILKLSKNLFKLKLKKEAQEILILEGISPEFLLPMLNDPCSNKDLSDKSKKEVSDLEEILDELFEDKESKEDKSSKEDSDKD